MILRPLGSMEYTYWMMGLSSRTNFTVTSRLAGSFSNQSLVKALGAVQKKQQLLNVIIVPDRRYGAVFEYCPAGTPIPLQVEDFPSPPENDLCCDTPFIRRIEKEQQTDLTTGPPPSTSSRPLMRCLLLRHGGDRSTLVLTFHHAIADALSAVSLLRDLLEHLSGDANDGAQMKDCRNEVPAPLDTCLPKHSTGIAAFGKLATHSFLQTIGRIHPGQVHLPVDLQCRTDERRDRFITTVLDQPFCTVLLRTAKENGCTVHSALCASLLLALREEYPSKAAIRTWLLSLVDLRRRFIPPGNAGILCLMISMIESLFSVSRTTPLWSLAAEIVARNDRLIRSGFHFSYFPAMTRIIRATSFLRRGDTTGSRKMLRQGQLSRPPVLSVSTIGNIEPAGLSGAVHCDEVSFFLPLSSSGLFGAAINRYNGRLYWNFSYAAPAISQERARRLAGRSVEILKNAL